MFQIAYPSGTLYKDGVAIPLDDSTPEYQEYIAFLQTGAGPEVIADPEPLYPRIEVSAWQIRKALNREGLRDAVEQAVAASGNAELQDGYQYAPYFFSDDPFALQVGAALGKSRAEMQALYELAASL